MSYPFVHTNNQTVVTGRKVELVVLHTIEDEEKGDSAESCARYFATTTKEVSAHYCVDNNSIVQCVRLKDVAWCAPGANHNGVHIEHAGRAGQDYSHWKDRYSIEMLALSALLCARICKTYKLPVVYVGPAGLRAGKRGVTTHAAVSEAFRESNHFDPGKNFPRGEYLGLVRAHLSLLQA